MSQELTKTSKEILLETNTWKCECIIGIILVDQEVAPRPNGAPKLFKKNPFGERRFSQEFSWVGLEEVLKRVSNGKFVPHYLG